MLKPNPTPRRGSPPAEVRPATFLVLPGGDCVPVDGPLRVEELRGEFYVLGNGTWERCESHQLANARLDQRRRDLSPHGLAAQTLESLELEFSRAWESHS